VKIVIGINETTHSRDLFDVFRWKKSIPNIFSDLLAIEFSLLSFSVPFSLTH